MVRKYPVHALVIFSTQQKGKSEDSVVSTHIQYKMQLTAELLLFHTLILWKTQNSLTVNIKCIPFRMFLIFMPLVRNSLEFRGTLTVDAWKRILIAKWIHLGLSGERERKLEEDIIEMEQLWLDKELHSFSLLLHSLQVLYFVSSLSKVLQFLKIGASTFFTHILLSCVVSYIEFSSLVFWHFSHSSTLLFSP